MTFRTTRGETFSLALEALDLAGNPLSQAALTGMTCRAELKASLNGGAPGDVAPVLAEFTVSDTAEVVPGGGAGFILTLGANTTAGLAVGNYVVDARAEFPNGVVIMSALQRVTLEERVTV